MTNAYLAELRIMRSSVPAGRPRGAQGYCGACIPRLVRTFSARGVRASRRCCWVLRVPRLRRTTLET